MSNVFGKKLYTCPGKRANCHFMVESQTKFALDHEANRLKASKTWIVNEILRRALIEREIEIKPSDAT